MADRSWDGDWEGNENPEKTSGTYSFVPELDADSGLLKLGNQGRPDEYDDDDWAEIMPSDPAQARVAQYERGFAPRNAFITAGGGLNYGLQSFDRKGWGNPQWRFTAGSQPDVPGGKTVNRPKSFRPGYQSMIAPEPKFYTDPMWKPLYDFTVRGGGWMPEDPFDLIGGDMVPIRF